MTSGCRGTPYFRKYDRDLVLKPAISLMKSWGGYRSKTLDLLFCLGCDGYYLNICTLAHEHDWLRRPALGQG